MHHISDGYILLRSDRPARALQLGEYHDIFSKEMHLHECFRFGMAAERFQKNTKYPQSPRHTLVEQN